MSKAYVETTVLTDILIKPGSAQCRTAINALKRYEQSQLPVYSIKEWKAGPLDNYSYFHDKLHTTKSLAATIAAVHQLYMQPYKLGTSLEALETAVRLVSDSGDTVTDERELADRYRYALESLIFRSWRRRRKVTDETIQDLSCYTEAAPQLNKKGLFDFSPKFCDGERECCLADELKDERNRELLIKLRDSIPETSIRKEDRNRRKVLKKLINTPKLPLMREECRQLGDAIFAFFAPEDCVILTTNLKDHQPLAKALGKTAEAP